jgi:hypothetical protein
MVVEQTAQQRSASLITAFRAPDRSTPRPPRMIGRFAAASRSTASATSSGSGCMRPTLGWYIVEVS